jgi:hypothetical protein
MGESVLGVRGYVVCNSERMLPGAQGRVIPECHLRSGLWVSGGQYHWLGSAMLCVKANVAGRAVGCGVIYIPG